MPSPYYDANDGELAFLLLNDGEEAGLLGARCAQVVPPSSRGRLKVIFLFLS